MSVEKLPLGLGNISVEPGTHIAFPYRDEQERARFLFAYIKAGLANGERCVAAILEYTPDFWMQGLADLGVDAKPIIGKQLVVLGPEQICPDRAHDVDAAYKELFALAHNAADDGWRNLRVCTGLTPFLYRPDVLPIVLRRESSACMELSKAHALMLCTVNENRLHEQVLDLCLKVHSALLMDGRVEPNSNYVSPGEYSHQLPDTVRRLASVGLLCPPFASLGFEGNVPVLKVNGEMDVFTAPLLEDLGRSLSLVGHSQLVVDLSRAPFLDAAAISTLLRLNNIARSKGGRLAVYDPEDPLRRIFEIIHLDQVIPIRHDLREAVCEVHR